MCTCMYSFAHTHKGAQTQELATRSITTVSYPHCWNDAVSGGVEGEGGEIWNAGKKKVKMGRQRELVGGKGRNTYTRQNTTSHVPNPHWYTHRLWFQILWEFKMLFFFLNPPPTNSFFDRAYIPSNYTTQDIFQDHEFVQTHILDRVGRRAINSIRRVGE